MIHTIEIAPHIMAEELSKKLSEAYYIYEHPQDFEPISRHDLREFIREFLTNDTMPGR